MDFYFQQTTVSALCVIIFCHSFYTVLSDTFVKRTARQYLLKLTLIKYLNQECRQVRLQTLGIDQKLTVSRYATLEPMSEREWYIWYVLVPILTQLLSLV